MLILVGLLVILCVIGVSVATKVIYVYGDMRIVFNEGKVADVQ
jgi:hypothetical protein